MFMNEKARNQLLEKGFVYTLRCSRHIIGIEWATDKRGGKKLCDVRISYIDSGNYSKLLSIISYYVKHSGFSTKEEWLNTFMSYNNKCPDFWLYKVERWFKW